MPSITITLAATPLSEAFQRIRDTIADIEKSRDKLVVLKARIGTVIPTLLYAQSGIAKAPIEEREIRVTRLEREAGMLAVTVKKLDNDLAALVSAIEKAMAVTVAGAETAESKERRDSAV